MDDGRYMFWVSVNIPTSWSYITNTWPAAVFSFNNMDTHAINKVFPNFQLALDFIKDQQDIHGTVYVNHRTTKDLSSSLQELNFGE